MSLETKIQIEALKRLERGLPVSYEQSENFKYLMVDGYYVIKIPDDSFFLDVSKIRESKSLASKFDISCRYALSETKDMRAYTDIIINCTKRATICPRRILNCTNSVIHYKEKVARLFYSEKDAVYADEKLLKKLTVNDAELFTDEKLRYIYFVKDCQIYAVMLSVKFCESKEEY